MTQFNPEILFEDEDILALNKPAGFSVHHDGKKDEVVVTDWLLEKYPEINDVGEPMRLQNGEEVLRPGIVHRIDKETSGVLLIAKNNESYEYLKEQFQEREIQKTYFAFLEGNLKEERGIINKAIGRSKTDARKRVIATNDGKEALTVWKNLGNFVHKGKSITFIEAYPKSGRTHQLRVHFKSIHHAILGDGLYGKRQNPLGFKRLALHAGKIAFKNMDGKEVEVSASFPEDFLGVFKILGVEEKNLRK